MIDNMGRVIDYMRISLTDKCNLKCQYCIPAEGLVFNENEALLSNGELIRLVHASAQLGIKKIRLTGGEPLLRNNIVDLVRNIKSVQGIEELAMTTNGILLNKSLNDLLDAGLDRVNISLDTLKPERFKEICGTPMLTKVKWSILNCVNKKVPVKINTVIIKGLNDDEVFDLIELTKYFPLDLRFIELMPIGCGSNFAGPTSNDLLKLIEASKVEFSYLKQDPMDDKTTYIQIQGHKGRVGFISPMTHQFCNRCNRVRVTSEGGLKSCLYGTSSLNLKEVFESGVTDTELIQILKSHIYDKPKDNSLLLHSENRERKIMSQIGG